jgi:hypothetical protein
MIQRIEILCLVRSPREGASHLERGDTLQEKVAYLLRGADPLTHLVPHVSNFGSVERGGTFISHTWQRFPLQVACPPSLGSVPLSLFNKALFHCNLVGAWELCHYVGIVSFFFIGIKKGFGGYIGVYFHVWRFYVQCLIVRYNLLMRISCLY